MVTLAAAAVSLMNATIQLKNTTIVPLPTSQPLTRVEFTNKNGYRKI